MEEKSYEIIAIPDLLDKIQVKGQVVTIDAMGTQTAIAEKIRKKRADYVLALKGNQRVLSDGEYLLANLQKGVERLKKCRDGGENHPKRRFGEEGIPLFYQQSERRYQVIFQSGPQTLECGKYALAS